MKATDRHHILWYKKNYAKGWAKRLRDYWYCRLEIPRDTLHRAIHYEVANIPVPRASSIKCAILQLDMLERYGAIAEEDTLEKRLMVLMALFDKIEPETYAALRKQYEIVHSFYKDPH